MHAITHYTRGLLAMVGLALAAGVALAEAPEEFYRGRQITMLVGSGAGGGYDI